ncbi:efflux RND transporter permease subunit [Desulfatiferula olefinivorans]
MNLTALALRWNRLTVVLVAVIIIGGLLAAKHIPQAEDPGFIIRTAMVSTYFPGASPERVERLVTDKLEKAVQEIPELDYVKSESRTGISIIYVNIKNEYKKLRPIWDDLRRKVDAARTDLPDEIIGPFVNDEFGDVFGIIMTLTGEGFRYAELKDIADEVKDELLCIDDVARVDIYGAQDERIFIEFNNSRLAELGMSPMYVRQILDGRNIIIPGGSVTAGHERIALEPTGNFESAEEILKTVVTLPGKDEVVYLGDLVSMTRGYIDPPSSIMHHNGVPCLGLGISMRDGGNILTLGEEVSELRNRILELYPIGIEFDFLAFQPDRVHRSVSNFRDNLFQSIAIVIAVMLIALGLRTGVLVAGLIPVTIMMALLVMRFLGIGIDQISLAALLIALGILVDNAIVISESIMTQCREGKPVKQAAIDSAAELARPLLTASLTTSLAFLPIFMAKSSVGEYTAPLFKVVSITLVSSWFLALTVIPLLCVRFLKVAGSDGEGSYQTPFYKWYRRMIEAMLRHRLPVLGLIIVLFVAAMAGFRYVPKRFMPDSDRSIITALIRTPPGSDIHYTERQVAELERFIRSELMIGPDREEGVVNWGSFIGKGAPRYILPYSPEPPESSVAYMIINTTNFEAVMPAIQRLEHYCDTCLPDLTVKIARLPVGPPVNHPVAVRLSGKETDRLLALVDQVKERLRQMPGVRQTGDDWGMRTKKLVVRINQERARRAGVSSQDIAVSLQSMLSGVTIGRYRENDDLIPITLRSVAADRTDMSKLESLNVYALAGGRSVSLKQVADVEVVWEQSKILRRDRLKTVEVYADLYDGYNALEINEALTSWLDGGKRQWGLGYRYDIAGEAEKSAESNASIAEQLPFAAMLILLLLVAQFNSIRRPLILLSIVPLGMIGVTCGLLVAGSYFGFMTLLGIVALSGIVINNANVLLDRIRIEIEDNGLPPQRAIVEAAQRRLRPILLTTLTTAGGLIPLWIGGGPMFRPMAIAIIFGLLFATVITLGVVPMLYSLFFRVKVG